MAGNNNTNENVNIDAVDMPSYQNTGFGKSTGANRLQPETAKHPVDDATVNAQAKTQYQATFDIQQRGLSNQLSALIRAQADDADLLNKQYQQSVNTMMAKLAKRGLAVGATPQATTAALNRFKNEVMTERQTTYNVQQGGVRAAIKASNDDFDLGVKARANQIRNNSLKSLNALMTQMAQLQSSSFEDYVNYLLSKKKNSMQSQSAEIARKNLELDSKSADIAGKKIGLDSKSLDIARMNIGLDSKSVELAKQRLGVDDKSLDLKRKDIDLDAQSTEYARQRLGIDDKSLDLKLKNIGLDSQSAELAKQKLGIDDKSLDLKRSDIELDDKSTDYDKKKLEIAADDIALDKKFLKLKYKASGKSSSSKGKGKGGGKSYSSSSSASTGPTPTSTPGRTYFAGTKREITPLTRDTGLTGGNTKPAAKATESLF